MDYINGFKKVNSNNKSYIDRKKKTIKVISKAHELRTTRHN